MKVLAVGAHPDDIELGCAGALLLHGARGDELNLLVLTTGEQGPHAARSRIAEQEDAAAFLGANLFWGGFEDGAIPEGRDGIMAVEAVLHRTGADVVYAPGPQDTHQDHRAASIISMAAARRLSRILCYESPTSVGFTPQVYVDIEPYLEDKLRTIRAHTSQVLKNHLVDIEAVEAQARYHGFRSRIRYAEAFQAPRFVWDVAPRTEQAAAAETLRTSMEEVR